MARKKKTSVHTGSSKTNNFFEDFNMTLLVEFDLAKILERIEQKVDKPSENQLRLEGKVETLRVQVENLQKGQDEIKAELKETRNDVSSLYKWVSGLFLAAAAIICKNL